MAAQHASEVVDRHPIHDKPTKLRSPLSKNVTVIIIACFLIAARAAHTILCQPFKYVRDGKAKIDMSVYITLVEACSFPISLMIWIAMSIYSQGYIYVPNGKYRMSMYALMGFLDAVNSYCGAVGALGLHVAIYTVLKASSIVFSVTFSKMFTKKHFTAWHYLAIGTMFSASCLSIFSGSTDKKENDGDSLQFVLAAVASFASAASLGLLGVTTYKFVRHENQKSEMLCIAENNAFQALFMFIFLLPMLGMPEVSNWPRYCSLTADKYGTNGLIAISIGLFTVRPIMLFSSIAATSFASAALTRALGAPRRLIVIGACYFLFKDEKKPDWLKWLSVAAMCTSLMIYAYGGAVLQKMKKKAQQASKPINVVVKCAFQPTKSPFQSIDSAIFDG